MSDDDAQRRPARFPPPFASAWGDDEFGLWAQFEIAGAGGQKLRQKIRWIEPGTFWMGSPEDEPERLSSEGPRHLVTVSEGFWLADTACTQALWTALVGSNPSRFNDDEQLPVEQVSWEDVAGFLRALEKRLRGCTAELPTEAQWEYAARAGTETPFSFGTNITPAEVNYNGNHPDADGERGDYRERTIPVGSLPPNPWGLYEMHGNVWEWCADGPRRYSSEPVRDPLGPVDESARRALRGGSWFDRGWIVRSACRYADSPGRRLDHFGFRFCLRSKKISEER